MSELSLGRDLRDERYDALLESLLSHNSIISSNEATSSSRAKLLQANFVNINQVNNDGQTALMVAAGMGHADIVELIIDHEGLQKLDINVRDIDNKTALHYAVASGSSKCVALLLEVPGIEIDINLELYIRGKECRGITKMVQDSRASIWKKTKDFENLIFEVCNGDLCQLPEPWEPDHVQVKKSIDLIKRMCSTENEIFCLDNGKLADVKWVEYPELVILNTIKSLLAFYSTDLTELQEKLVSNNPPNLQYFLNIKLVDLIKNPGMMTPTIFEGNNFNAKEILQSMTYGERTNLIEGLVNIYDLSKYSSEIFNQGVKFYIDGVDRALGLPCEFNVAEFQSQFSFCKSVENYQDAYDLNQTYWEKITNQNASCRSKLLDRDGGNLSFVTTFGEYIAWKGELLCEMGRLDEARELYLGALKDLEKKTVHMGNGKSIKLSQTEVKYDLGLVIESLYIYLSTISAHGFDFEEALEILDRNVVEGMETRLDAVKSNHISLKQLMTKTNYVAKESLGEDFDKSKIIVNPFLEKHYIDMNGKIFVESLDKAVRISKNGDVIFLKNGEHHLGHALEDGKMATALDKNVTIIGESTNETILNVSFHKRTMAEIQFKRLNIKIGSTIHVSEGKISLESCLVDGYCDPFFTLDKQHTEIDLHLCCFTSTGTSSFVQLNNSDSTIKLNITKCLFADFNFIIRDSRMPHQRCGFELYIESCSFLGIKLTMIALDYMIDPSMKQVESMLDMATLGHFPSSQKEPVLPYPTSVVIRNCFVEVLSNIQILDIGNACHVLIESTKFNAKGGDPSDDERKQPINTGLRFANIQRLEIVNIIVSREGSYNTLTSLRTYLEKLPKEGSVYDAAIQLMAVHEATIRNSIIKGFYCGISTKSRHGDVNKVDRFCFTGIYNCQLSNMAVCVLLDSRFTSRSIFVLSDISFRDSLVGVRVSEACCWNGSVDVLDAKFINIASPIVVPKDLKKDAKDEKKNLISRFDMKNLTFPDGGPQNSRKKRRDGVIKNLMKAGVLDSTASIPYLENIFKPKGDWLEIANDKDLEPFDFQESRPQSTTSDYQSDYDDSVD